MVRGGTVTFDWRRKKVFLRSPLFSNHPSVPQKKKTCGGAICCLFSFFFLPGFCFGVMEMGMGGRGVCVKGEVILACNLHKIAKFQSTSEDQEVREAKA